jgi:prolyl-tRNA synthetase
MHDWICGANVVDFHSTGVNWGRDLPEPDLVADIRNVVAGDTSPDGKGELAIERGIEVGHVFYLGTKYSRAMNATFLDENGKPQFMEMGCYGIGVTRLPAAAIEQNHDAKGIIWPDAIAPFTVVICPIGMDRSDAVKTAAENLYQDLLKAGVDVILDDRGERPGAMFADWELIGVPHRVTIGDRGLKDGFVEYQHRRDTQAGDATNAGSTACVGCGSLGAGNPLHCKFEGRRRAHQHPLWPQCGDYPAAGRPRAVPAPSRRRVLSDRRPVGALHAHRFGHSGVYRAQSAAGGLWGWA